MAGRLTVLGVAILIAGCSNGAPPAEESEPSTAWFMNFDVDDFTDEVTITMELTGESRPLRLQLWLQGCNSAGDVRVWVTALTTGAGRFPAGIQTIDVRWDGGVIEGRPFIAELTDLSVLEPFGGPAAHAAFLQELAGHSELRIRVRMSDGGFVSDTFDLTVRVLDMSTIASISFSDALAMLECEAVP